VDYIPTPDVLLRGPTLAHELSLPVLGVATRFETNSRWVCDVAEEAFGAWRRGGPTDGARDGEAGVRVRVVVHEGREGEGGRAPVRHICPDATRLVVHSPGSVAVADPARGEAVAFVTTELAADRAHFRTEVLEAITLALLAQYDRHPVHAAAVAGAGRAVLLAGPSGAGKSTLAYVAHAAGLDVLSEDRVWVQLAPELRVWGSPGRIRLRREAYATLPGLARDSLDIATDGSDKLLVTLPHRASAPPLFADDTTVCVLHPGGARAALERVEPTELLTALHSPRAPGFDRSPERHERVAATLAARGGWRLTLSADPRDAVRHLMTMLVEG
jgi:hypothetical protein